MMRKGQRRLYCKAAISDTRLAAPLCSDIRHIIGDPVVHYYYFYCTKHVYTGWGGGQRFRVGQLPPISHSSLLLMLNMLR